MYHDFYIKLYIKMEVIEDDKPIQIVSIDPAGNFVLHTEALNMIRAIKKKIAIVTVAGQYRTGKSFLLNRLIGRLNGFELGSTINPCTKGLWTWNKPLPVTDDVQAIFLDTEGLSSFNRNVHVDMKIFALSLLMSSYFIFNSMNALDEKALESLGMVVSLSKYIHVRSNPANVSEELDEYSQYFPFFMWIVRDFALVLADPTQQPITDRQYLENVLRPVDTSKYPDPEQAALKNEVCFEHNTGRSEENCQLSSKREIVLLLFGRSLAKEVCARLTSLCMRPCVQNSAPKWNFSSKRFTAISNPK